MWKSYTVSAQIEQHCSNMTKRFFGTVALKFEPNMTVIIKNLAQKLDFWVNCRSNQDCRSICAGTVYYICKKYIFRILKFMAIV